jgi:hypothetical protein
VWDLTAATTAKLFGSTVPNSRRTFLSTPGGNERKPFLMKISDDLHEVPNANAHDAGLERSYLAPIAGLDSGNAPPAREYFWIRKT